jgi:hypothetical protein
VRVGAVKGVVSDLGPVFVTVLARFPARGFAFAQAVAAHVARRPDPLCSAVYEAQDAKAQIVE